MIQGLFWNDDINAYYPGHQFGEVYKDRNYDPYLPTNKKNTVCVDIGANIGVTSYFFSHYFEKVISLEPSKEHFECLSKMIQFNKLENVTPIRKALYMKEGEFDFYHPTNKTAFTLHTAVTGGPQLSPPEKVETITLTKLFEENKIDHVDLLKMDVEGSEFEILGGSDFKEVSDKISTIFIERHDWAGREPKQLEDTLKMRGFTVTKVAGQADLLVATK